MVQKRQRITMTPYPSRLNDPSPDSLALLGWSGYEEALDAVFRQFTASTGFKVAFVGCRNQDEMLHTARSAAGAGGFFDVACPTTDRLSSWIKEGLLQAWDEKSIHFDQIEGRFAADAHTVRNGKRMGSPNLWGSAALGYRGDSVAIDPQRASLMDLFDEAYAGKLMLREDTAFVAAGRALESAGRLPHPFADSYRDEVRMVANYDVILQFLRTKRHNVSRFWFSEQAAQQAFRTGACAIGYVWDTTVAALQEEGMPIRFAATVEGAACYIQNFVLLAGARNFTAANAWVAWVNTAQGGARYAQAFRAFSPVKGASALMDAGQRRFLEKSYPSSALNRLWWQPEQEPWFVKRREAYAHAFLAP